MMVSLIRLTINISYHFLLDTHLGNVLLQLPSDIDQLSDEQLHENYGLPRMGPVVRFDGREPALGVRLMVSYQCGSESRVTT